MAVRTVLSHNPRVRVVAGTVSPLWATCCAWSVWLLSVASEGGEGNERLAIWRLGREIDYRGEV